MSRMKASGKKNKKKDDENGLEVEEAKPCLSCKENVSEVGMGCSRCGKWSCLKCAKISMDQYEVIGSLPNYHWYCEKCIQPALIAVKSDAEIEARCKEYCKGVEDRLSSVEAVVKTKADKSLIDNLDAKILKMENDLKHFAKDISKTNVKIDLVRDEDSEKKKREMNVVIRGLQENEENDDKIIVEDLLNNIGCKELLKSITKIEG